ncbi:G-type lectin S-receptor-like serine/threonine-protein kinase LECRK1 isoform X1 [Hevea brasiliensis]|uniref:G-type lectin S-receptor-like serine/threonine-protein kinase LECRK1 isoform X1 n=1 Tax=Hevea brasiliensis TaxID=3981 RepID=UPI0025F0A460|nr:G-type lectin S-receptor-like serine/threonine-protein kinase LECRK1 isoform X1 [Hevea brasiliensis]
MNSKLKRMHRAQNLSMASVILFLFLSFTSIFKALAQRRYSNISLGSSLTPTTNSSWWSPSGLYAFGFYPQGTAYAIGVFIAGIPQKTVVWTAKRDDPPVDSNVNLLINDAGLVLEAQSQTTTVISAPQPASSASLFDSGNFVLYNSDRDIIWQSFDHPTDTLLPTQRLEADSELVSAVSETNHSTGIFRLRMQTDGNLVQYPVETPETAPYAYWSSGTDGSGNNVTLNFDYDGRLYLLNSTGFNIREITPGGYPTKETIFVMRIDFDGIFRLYSYNLKQNGNSSVLRESTTNKCQPKGLCGLNSYCDLNDLEPKCICLPGFASVNPGDRTAGCERNFTAESCKEDHKSIRIQEVLSTAWEDVSYSDLSLSIKGECEQACLQDCNCDAAFYKDGLCKKQKLPLRYGRRNPDESNSALIKVKSTSIRTNTDRNEPAVDKKKSDQLGRGVLIVGISVVAFGLVTLAISGILFHKYRVWAYKRISEKDHIGLSEEVAPRSFTFEELERVTDGFKEEIGRGSFGTVYKGLISSTQKVAAVKRLEGAASQGEREFQTEVKVIGKTHHKNLVRLLGYCNEGPNRLLVYEYMRNGSLADVIFSPESRPCFGERVEIARNIARGILYLHEECETQIIHCDIKPENILMDECWCPKISDFGLAKLLKPEQTKTFTGIRGTRGYVAPEWHRKLPVTVKADVYSFGIVLLEITCCRRNVDQNLPEIESILVDWVYHCFESGEIDKLVSEEEVDKRQMDRMIKVGLWCTLDEPSLRPSMKKVLLMLEGTVDIPIPPSPTSFLSAI